MQDKKENKNSTLEDEAGFSDLTKDNQEEHKNNKLEEKLFWHLPYLLTNYEKCSPGTFSLPVICSYYIPM